MRKDDDAAFERLWERMQALAAGLRSRPEALGLLALGSLGGDAQRVDEWSDLDFFVIVQPEAKARYIADLDWLAAAHPLIWHFQNTQDGHKALMADGMYCEFAVFAPDELGRVPYSPGRWLWLRADRAEALGQLAAPAVPMPQPRSAEWLLGEALSNLLVGLQRDHRGEKLAAMRLIQVYAVDRVLELIELLDSAPATQHAKAERDAFAVDRRVEQRWPEAAALLPQAAAGYLQNRAAAKALLAALQARTAIPAAMRQAIERLL